MGEGLSKRGKQDRIPNDLRDGANRIGAVIPFELILVVNSLPLALGTVVVAGLTWRVAKWTLFDPSGYVPFDLATTPLQDALVDLLCEPDCK